MRMRGRVSGACLRAVPSLRVARRLDVLRTVRPRDSLAVEEWLTNLCTGRSAGASEGQEECSRSLSKVCAVTTPSRREASRAGRPLSMFQPRRRIFYLPPTHSTPPTWQARRQRHLANELRWFAIWLPLAILGLVVAARLGGAETGCATQVATLFGK